MPLKDRQKIFKKIETLRGGRTFISFFNFDRPSEPTITGLNTQFAYDTKEALFRVLKESVGPNEKIDLCLYTRGGDTNAVWPIVSLLCEFDKDFEVLVPFRCHSSGTLLSLGAKKIVLTRISELSPIDPSTGNQFNPIDPVQPGQRLGISVEDVVSFRSFVLDQFKLKESEKDSSAARAQELLRPFLAKLVKEIHPLALGNIHRVYQLIQQLAKKLLSLHSNSSRNIDKVIDELTAKIYSHLHMINRKEALEILGKEQIIYAHRELDDALDTLLRAYEDDFNLRTKFYLSAFLGDELNKEVRFVGGAIESKSWSYLFETKAKIRQFSKVPPNIQVQLPHGQEMPLIPGLSREYNVDITSQGWIRNREPKGVTK